MNEEVPSLGGPDVMRWLVTVIGTLLDEEMESLRQQFPTVGITRYGGPVGNLTSFQGHDAGIDVSFASGDSLALSITVAYLTTTPRVFGDVGWSGSSAASEASTVEDWSSSSEWPVATKESLDHVQRDLPRLIDAFFKAIQRGRPRGDQGSIRDERPRVSNERRKVVPLSEMAGEDEDETKLLEAMAAEARDWVASHGMITKDIYFGGGVGGVVAIFLVHVGDGAFDSSGWVVVGDLPPAMLATSQSGTASKALLAYVALMRDWVSAIEQGGTPPPSPRIEAPADAEHANMLAGRLDMLEKDIYPYIRDTWS